MKNDVEMEMSVLSAFASHVWESTDTGGYDEKDARFCPICCAFVGERNIQEASRLPCIPSSVFMKKNLNDGKLIIIKEGWSSTKNHDAALKSFERYREK